MPVTDTHPDYDIWKARWERCRDAVAGSDDIKDAGSTYLPVPNGLEETDARYVAYKTRAKWFPAIARTIEGLEGEVFRNDPSIEVAPKIEETLNNVTLTGMSQEQYMRLVLKERLTTGRFGELIEFSDDLARTFSVGYCAENIINWRMSSDIGNQELQLVVMQEVVDNSDDIFSHDTIIRYRVLLLVDGVYTVEIHETITSTKTNGATTQLIETKQPTVRGKKLDFIPFIFYGVSENTADIEKPPLLDLVDLNIADWRNSADLEHGRHFCGLPMHYLFGAPEYEDGPIAVGAGEVLFSVNADAKAGIVEFTGQGLGALEKARDENRQEMALLGAKLLEESKKVGETSAALARRQSGKASVLQSMVEVQDQGHERSFEIKAEWEGVQGDARVSLNKDYVVTKLDAQEITALMAAWQGGGMSRASLFWNLQQGERLPPDTTFDDETAAIAEETPDFDDIGEAAGG